MNLFMLYLINFYCFYSRLSYHLGKLDCISEFNCNIFYSKYIKILIKYITSSYLHLGGCCLRYLNIFYQDYL